MKKLLLFTLCLLMFGCDNGDSGKVKKTIKFAGITNASTLYTVGKARRSRADESTEVAKLYKIDFEGNTSEVKFKDEAGNVINVIPEKIINLNKDMVLMSFFSFGDIQFEHNNYIIRKSDGACFIVPNDMAHEIIYSLEWHGMRKEPVTDIYDDIYYIYLDMAHLSIKKMSTDANGGITNQIITQNYPVLQHAFIPIFLVDKNLDILFDTSYNTMGLSQKTGKFYIDNQKFTSTRYTFTLNNSPDGGFYYINYGNSASGGSELIRISFANDMVSSNVVSDIPELKREINDELSLKTIIRKDKRTILMTRYSGVIVVNSVNDIKVYPDAKTFESWDLNDFPYSEDYVIYHDRVSHKGIIEKLDFSTGKTSIIFNDTNYAVDNITANNDGSVVNFTGFNISAGENVVCEIRNGVFKELERSQYKHEISTLIRIN